MRIYNPDIPTCTLPTVGSDKCFSTTQMSTCVIRIACLSAIVRAVFLKRSQICGKRQLASSCLSVLVCLFQSINCARTGQICVKFDIGDSLLKCGTLQNGTSMYVLIAATCVTFQREHCRVSMAIVVTRTPHNAASYVHFLSSLCLMLSFKYELSGILR